MSVRLGADISDFQKKMRQVNRDFAGIIQASEGMRDVGQSLSAYVTAPLTLLAGISLKSSANLEQLKNGLVSTTGSAKEAEKQFKRLNTIAKLPGLGLEQAVKASISLQSAGFSAEEAERNIKAFGNALAAAGRGSADLDGVTLALGQIISKGVISAEELNQLAERVPQIRKAMEAAFGTGDPMKLQKMGIDTKAFVAGVVTELEKIKPVAGGLANSFENFSDSSKIAFAKLGDAINKTFDVSGVLTTFADKLSGLAESFENLSPTAQKTIVVIGALAAAIGPLLVAVGTLGAALPALSVGFAAMLGPVGLITAALAAATAGLVYFIATSKSMKELNMEAIAKSTQDYLKIVGEPKSIQEFSEAQAYLNDKINQFEVGLSKAEKKLKALKKQQADAGIINLGGFQLGKDIEKQQLIVNAFKREIQGVNGALVQVKEQQAAFGKGAVQTTAALQDQKGVLEELRARLVSLNDQQGKASLEQLPRINKEIQSVQALIEKYTQLGLANKNSLIKAGDIGQPLKTPELDTTQKLGIGLEIPEGFNERLAAITASLGTATGAVSVFRDQFIDLKSNLEQNVSNYLTDSLVPAIYGIGDALGRVFSGEASGKEFFNSLIKIFAQAAAEYGKLTIALGSAKVALGDFSGIGAIAAGVALIAAAGIAGAMATPKKRSSPGGYSGQAGASGSSSTASVSPSAAANQETTVKIQGHDLIAVIRKQGYKDGR